MKQTWILIRTSFISLLVFTAVLGVAYPVAVWAVGQLLFHKKAQGSLIIDKATSQVMGSKLIAQDFKAKKYFHPRPSAAGAAGYDAANSQGSNLGPTSQQLANRVKLAVDLYRKENKLSKTVALPVDAVTASGSGLDPHISVANALMQAQRVANARKMSLQEVQAYIQESTEKRTFLILGEPRVNVNELNCKLDHLSN